MERELFNTAGYSNAVFISYDHKDEKIAKWLQRKLENYSIPPEIKNVKRSFIRDKIRPVFRDSTDITAGPLDHNLKKQLEASCFLVVVCSPAAAQSEWVNKEVAYFKELGRSNRIFPFIAEGEPPHCFPPALDMNDAGPILKKDGRAKAFTRLVAAILELNGYDILWKRHKRRLFARLFLAALLISAIALTGFKYWYDNYKSTTKYYADYVERWGIPNGIIELTSEEVSKRNGHYEFTYKGGQLQVVLYADSKGKPVRNLHTDLSNRPVQQKFEYNDKGTLIKVYFLNQNNEILVSYLYTNDQFTEVDLKDKGGLDISQSGFMNEFMPTVPKGGIETKGMISHYSMRRNDQGEVTRIKFGLGSRFPLRDMNGIFGKEFLPDSIGRIKQLVYLDSLDNRMSDRAGVSMLLYSYDRYGNISGITCLTKDSLLVENEEGWAIALYEANAEGNIETIKYFGKDKQPRLIKKEYATQSMQYDRSGFIVELAYYGVDNKLCLNGDGYSKQVRRYNIDRDTIDVSFLGVDGKPCITRYGNAGGKCIYDERKYPVESTNYDTSGALCLNKEGYAIGKWTYNSLGKIEQVTYWGTDGKPVLCKDGYAKIVCNYKNGNLTELRYFGVNGSPGFCKESHAIEKRTFDTRNNIMELTYYDANEKPIDVRDTALGRVNLNSMPAGFSDFAKQYFFNAKPGSESATHYQKVVPVYDSAGTITSVTYFDKKGTRICTRIWNSMGKIVKGDYYDVNGKLLNEDKYDDQGNNIESIIYLEKSLLQEEGYVRLVYKYSEDGKRVLTQIYSPSMGIIASMDEVSKRICVYDEGEIDYCLTQAQLMAELRQQVEMYNLMKRGEISED